MIRLVPAAVLAAALWGFAEAQPATLGGPAEDYSRAAELWDVGEREEAAYLFYRAQFRAGLDMLARPDQEPSGNAVLYASFDHVFGAPINGWLGGDPDLWIATVRRSLEWGRAHDDPFTPRAEHPDVYESVLTELEEFIAQIDRSRELIRTQREANRLENR